jgi:hypothetical protein
MNDGGQQASEMSLRISGGHSAAWRRHGPRDCDVSARSVRAGGQKRVALLDRRFRVR